MRSTFTEEPDNFQNWSLAGEYEQIVFLKQFSCLWKSEQRTHIRSQAELVNRFCFGGSQGGETSWDQWYS